MTEGAAAAVEACVTKRRRQTPTLVVRDMKVDTEITEQGLRIPPVTGTTALLAVFTGFILYGSLYPFSFLPVPAWSDLIGIVSNEWRRPLGSRGDVLANLLLYAPFGFLLAGRARSSWRPTLLLGLTAVIGGLLSALIELAQMFVEGRTSSLWDVLFNTLGASAGGIAALCGGIARTSRHFDFRALRAAPFAVFLLLTWLGYRLYPYVPTLDLQAYRNSLKPLFLTPTFEPLRSVRLAVCWLVAAHCMELIAGRHVARLLVPAALIASLGAGVVIVGRTLTLAEPLGIGAAWLGWILLRRSPSGMPIMATLMLTIVVCTALEPFSFVAVPKSFGWVPFRSLMHGPWDSGLQAMLQKTFLYGSMLWLLVGSSLSLQRAACFSAILVLTLSIAQRHMPGRSGEITDTLLVLGLAVVFHVLRPDPNIAQVEG